jgi:hypothetical protein
MLHAWQSRYTAGRSPSTLGIGFFDWVARAANAPFQTAASAIRRCCQVRRTCLSIARAFTAACLNFNALGCSSPGQLGSKATYSWPMRQCLFRRSRGIVTLGDRPQGSLALRACQKRPARAHGAKIAGIWGMPVELKSAIQNCDLRPRRSARRGDLPASKLTGDKKMSTILIIIILILLFGGGGGYWAYGNYGGAGLRRQN